MQLRRDFIDCPPGTAFNELDAGISYFIGRMEIKAGYQAKMIHQGPSLHGPYVGMNWNF